MATLTTKTDDAGKPISYKFTCCVGRDDNGKQIWRTKTIKSPGLTPKKEKDFVILLSYKNNDYILKGNYYYNSSVPENCDFFFPINKRGKIIWFNKNILSLIKVARPSR